jgi:hypothetical protein
MQPRPIAETAGPWAPSVRRFELLWDMAISLLAHRSTRDKKLLAVDNPSQPSNNNQDLLLETGCAAPVDDGSM